MTASPERTTPNRALAARLLLGAVVVVAGFLLCAYWVEAEKEARVLCALSGPGTEAAEVDRLFGTANLLQVTRSASGAGVTLHVASNRNLGLTGCEVALENDVVVTRDYRERFTLAPAAGVVALLLMGALLLLQLALAAGVPLGHLAWGGAQRRLDRRRRAASGVVALVLVVGMAAWAELAGLLSLPWLAPAAETVVALLTLTFTLSVFANLASSSARERWTGAPLALLLACCGVVQLLAG